MLKLHFFNVAEGDSILLDYEGGKSPFRVLVDTGRAFMPESQGSLRHTAAWHLRKLNIDFIDVLVLTHLHVDHIQDLPEILKSVRFGSICSTYFPPDPGRNIADIQSDLKPVRELPKDLNTLAESIRKAKKAGTKIIPVTGDVFVPIDQTYGSILIRMPVGNTLDFQNSVCDQLFNNEPVSEMNIYRAAKSRNNNSLRLLVKYAERTIALDGDYYATDAEKEYQEQCDILKVAHHGDKKSMTDKLASMLRPKYAVISCMREYVEEKDRPSKNTADSLRKYGAEIMYTDCFEESGHQPEYHDEILISIDENGTIKVF